MSISIEVGLGLGEWSVKRTEKVTCRKVLKSFRAIL